MTGEHDTEEALDPVCGEVFPPALATFWVDLDGDRIYFCSSTCKESFESNPDEYPAVQEGRA